MTRVIAKKMHESVIALWANTTQAILFPIVVYLSGSNLATITEFNYWQLGLVLFLGLATSLAQTFRALSYKYSEVSRLQVYNFVRPLQ